MPVDIEAQLRAMNSGLQIPAAEIDLNDVVPMFVPASLLASGTWKGPSTKLRSRAVGLMWTVLMPNQTMRYVDAAMRQHWEARRLDWKEVAMRNLAARTQNVPGLYQMERPNGEIYAISCMFEDGLGPSRLLFRGTLRQMFPDGYRVAIPERSCAFAFSTSLTESEQRQIEEAIDNCYRKGTRPFIPGSFDPDELLPEEQA